MGHYQYVARNAKGQRIKGRLEANDERQLIQLLRDQDLSIITISETKSRGSGFGRSGKAPLAELVIFTRQLATMTSAGIPLLQSIDVLREQTEDRHFRRTLGRVHKSIASGSNLSLALVKEGRSFSELFISMVKAGEEGGGLDEILDRLATYMESTQRLIAKVKSAMIYPIVVTLMAVSITLLLLMKVIPVFKQMYADFDAELPKPTLILIQISDTLIAYFPIFTIAIILTVFIFLQFIRTRRGGLWFDGFKLRLPVMGPIFRKLAISKFSRTLSTLVKSGVPILKALEIVAKTAGNKVIEKAVMDSRLAIRDGARMADPMKNTKVFPPLVVRMIAVGESTGELERMLSKIATFYEDQTEAAISGLTSIIEPVIIAFLGIVVGGIVICMFLPIFSLANIISV